MKTTIRKCSQQDFESLAQIMFDAVRSGTSRYSEEQRQAWVPEVRGGPEWVNRLAAQTIFGAESDDVLAGFISLSAGGYIDMAYIRPAFQNQGLFRQLMQSIEETAVEQGEQRLWVHASLMAEPAFTAAGFRMVREETVEMRGQSFRRFEMEKLFLRLPE